MPSAFHSSVTAAGVIETILRPTGPGYTGFETLSGATMDAKVGSAPSANKVTFLPGTYSFDDFTIDNPGAQAGQAPFNGMSVTNLGLIGSGVDNTIIQMTPNTSTYPKNGPAGTLVPPTGSGTTNPLNLIRSQNSGAMEFANFHLKGTTQDNGACYYNGIRITGTNSYVHDMKVSGIPGYSSINPGETFAINMGAVNGFTIANVEMDGRNLDTGTSVMASAIGVNACTDGVINDCYIHDVQYCKSFAFWEHHNGATFNRINSNNVAFHYGFEQSGGTFTINDCTFGTATRADIHIANNGSYNNGATATVIINNPIFPAGKSTLKVLVSTSELGSPNIQTSNDVKAYDANGNDISSSVLTFVTSA